jgi:histidinol-phosphate aminotransferase
VNINELLRTNIKALQPYSSARDEFKGKASVYLDANENPYNTPFNRYPDPLQWELKQKIALQKNVPAENIFLGNGSDEPIDLLFRAFCEPRADNVVAIEPTYGMYRVCAQINDVEYRTVLLDENFDIEAYKIIDATNKNTKIIFLCSPNNPTANLLNKTEITKLLQWFRGIVVVDEAYIDFAEQESFLTQLSEFSNLVVLQTFSKAWGNAGIRLGMAFGSVEVIDVLNKIKYPYNVNILTQHQAMLALDNAMQTEVWIREILAEKEILIKQLEEIRVVQQIYRSDANFVLVRVENAKTVYQGLTKRGIVVRNRGNITLCDECLRITVGTSAENNKLIKELRKL